MIARPGEVGEHVALLQRRLARAGYSVDENHIYDRVTEKAVRDLQAANGLVVDGIAGPKTMAALGGAAPAHFLTAADLEKASQALGVELAAVRAVNEVESRGHGMLPSTGKPVILFERHVFWQQLQAHGIDPALAAVKFPLLVSQEPGGYRGGPAEYTRLATAVMIDRDAALESCSWGLFQIMGYWWKAMGYDSVAQFVECMGASEGEQLDAFVRFLTLDVNKGMLAALKARKWKEFARLYNGKNYAANLYDVKLAKAYDKYAELDQVAA
ncbi:N-acetylmuramidase domain-containing protein [Massilia sp. YIM B02763]|uniref:N-acetylmuramidase domain-containing protein n=1 Tax=Massilia sp. YIM B02763 TaxID=3050130 RepID=UPI0035A73AF0